MTPIQIKVSSAEQFSDNPYSVSVGLGITTEVQSQIALTDFSSLIILTEPRVSKSWLAKLQESLPKNAIVLEEPISEHTKNLDTVESIWQKLLELNIDRKALLITLGGGVVGDLGGFVASTYRRGIAWLNIPTTLISQVDACIGGKVGVNFANLKNQIGSFYDPISVMVDPETLSTLPQREYFSGFAEIIKYALIGDTELYSLLKSIALEKLDTKVLVPLIVRCLEAKARIVTHDKWEAGVRKVLNFGHTIGHAIESAALLGPRALLHGEAISIGMVGEAFLSFKLGLLQEKYIKELEELLLRFKLPIRIRSGITSDEIQERMRFDKKGCKGTSNFSLLEGIGCARIDVAVEEGMILDGLQYLQEDRS